jgi:hypothetical protein
MKSIGIDDTPGPNTDIHELSVDQFATALVDQINDGQPLYQWQRDALKQLQDLRERNVGEVKLMIQAPPSLGKTTTPQFTRIVGVHVEPTMRIIIDDPIIHDVNVSLRDMYVNAVPKSRVTFHMTDDVEGALLQGMDFAEQYVKRMKRVAHPPGVPEVSRAERRANTTRNKPKTKLKGLR